MLLGPHLPKLARQAKDLAIIRSMSSKEGDHGRATYYLRTGYLPQGPIRYPTLGSLVANEFDDESAELPGFVSISPVRAINAAAFTSGFLGPKCAPLNVGERNLAGGAMDAGSSSLRVEDLDVPRGIGRPRADERLELMQTLGKRLPRQPPRRPVVQPPECLPSGREDDAVVGRQGVRPGRGARRRPRRLRPEPVRPGLPAGPPAGRAWRPVRRGDALLGRRHQWPGLGHPRAELRRRREALRRPRRRLVDPDDRPPDPRPARQHPDRLDGRVRPDAEDQRVRRPRPFPQRLVDRPGRRRDPRRPGDRRHRGRRRDRSRTGPSWSPTCSRPSSRAWGSTRPSRTPSRTAGRSGSSTPRPNPIKELLG